jgi:hypothetical protein
VQVGVDASTTVWDTQDLSKLLESVGVLMTTSPKVDRHENIVIREEGDGCI